jgi:hypothetical protein
VRDPVLTVTDVVPAVALGIAGAAGIVAGNVDTVPYVELPLVVSLLVSIGPTSQPAFM